MWNPSDLARGAKKPLRCFTSVLLASMLFGEVQAERVEITPRLSLYPGAVNCVMFNHGDAELAIYGAASHATHVAQVLLAHGRRDAVWAAAPAITSGARVVAPLPRARRHSE